METGVRANGRARGQLLLILGLVLLIRLPFLNQAIQGDDPIYLAEATHAQIDPLHPDDTKYVFRGETVDLRGQPHPPLDGWVLGGILAAVGKVREVPFHAAYIAFSLIAAAAMWGLARRFSPQPVWATLLFIAVPVFLVNGNSLETDLPFLAFWTASIALFVWRKPLAYLCMALAALTAYQAVLLTPILAVYVWIYHRRSIAAWLSLLIPEATLAVWQVFERLTTGAFPAVILAGYLHSFQTPVNKLHSALALSIHSWFIVFPALVPAAFWMAWRKRREPDMLFLLAWVAIFYASALTIFFAGSARYLLPVAAPFALLASRLRPRWLAIGFAAQLTLGLGLAAMNYQHWDGYRRFAQALRPLAAGHRVWIDDGWGLSFYLERQGGIPLTKTRQSRPGDIVAASELGHSLEVAAPVAVVLQREIRPSIPLRLIGLESHSGYSDASRGLWPFGISTGVVDRVRAEMVLERHPTLEYVSMTDPRAADHLVSGVWPADHWMSNRAALLIRSPAAAMPLSVTFYIPDNAPARHITLSLDGKIVAEETVARPGLYTLSSPGPLRPAGATANIEIAVDRTFAAPPDTRELGAVLIGAGFRP
jgi:hypothetical protein